MTRSNVLGLVILVVVGLGACSSTEQRTVERDSSSPGPGEFGRNASFTMNDESVTLVDGTSSAPRTNGTGEATTRYLGGEAEGDLNGDGLDDLSFWVTQDAGGSGTFHYVVVALKTPSGYTTTNAFLVGDRITPESMQIRGDARELHVNFLDRKPGEPMTAPPTEAKVLLLKVSAAGVLEGLMS